MRVILDTVRRCPWRLGIYICLQTPFPIGRLVMYRRIMVPVDGSRFAEFAVPYALAIAEEHGAFLDLIRIDAPLPAMSEFTWAAPASERGMPYLEELRGRISEVSEVEMSLTAKVGGVVRELTKHATSGAADLVVMSTHGRGPMSRFWLGSTADAFVRECTVPTFLVRPIETRGPDFSERPELTRALVPLDGSAASESALRHARKITRNSPHPQRILRVVHYPAELASPYLPDAVMANQQVLQEGQKRAKEYLAEISDRMREEGVKVQTEVIVASHPAMGIIEATEEECPDFVCMSTHGRGGVTRAVLGSVADKVVRGLKVPLLLIRPEVSS